MKLWLTAAEIAELGLPNLPTTKQGVNLLVVRGSWIGREGLRRHRQGQGGGFEYHIDVLPPEARQAYVSRHVIDVVPQERAVAAEAEPKAAQLIDRAVEARDARLALIAAADRLARDAKLPRRHADILFVRDYASGRLDMPTWVKKAASKLTLRTLQRWRATATSGRTHRLGIDRGAARRGTGVLDRAEDGQVRLYCLALLVRQPHLTADHIHTLLRGRFGATLSVAKGDRVETVALPPVRTLQHSLRRWKEAEHVTLTALTNPDAFKSRYRASGTNTDRSVTRLNEVWQIDASPMDALCLDGRHSVYLAIDVFSRRALVYVSRTPRAEAVGLLLRRAILAWGVPERIKTDNGSDFTAKASQRLLAALGIERELAPAFTPEAKAFVERVIGTFQRDLGPLLPGFIGHSVADRKVIEARRAFAQRLGQTDEAAFCVELTGAQLQIDCDAWAADRYQHRPHAGLGGATPFAAAAAYPGGIRRIEDERALDMLLAPVAGRDGLRTVTKQGVRVDGSFYLAPHVLPETAVVVRMDPADMGRAYLFDAEGGTFLGEAICPDLAGIDPAEAVARAKRAQREFIAAGTAEIRREARKFKSRDMVDGILRDAARTAGKLVELPRPTTPHSTPQIEAALAAVAGPRTVEAAPLDKASDALRAEIEAELAGGGAPSNVTRLRREETAQQRFRRALEVQQRIERSEVVSTEEAIWLGGYQAGPEFQSLADLYADFGEAALR